MPAEDEERYCNCAIAEDVRFRVAENFSECPGTKQAGSSMFEGGVLIAELHFIRVVLLRNTQKS